MRKENNMDDEIQEIVVPGLYDDILMLCGGHKEIEDEYVSNILLNLIVEEYEYLVMAQKSRRVAMEELMQELADKQAKKNRKGIKAVTTIKGTNDDTNS